MFESTALFNTSTSYIHISEWKSRTSSKERANCTLTKLAIERPLKCGASMPQER